MKHYKYLTYLFLIFLTGMLLTSCNSLIYDEEGDCDPYHKVRFVFDYNLKFSDSFSKEVGEVTLYVVDEETGEIVLEKHDDSSAVSQSGYLMDLDGIAPGKYTLVAWCGPGHKTHFTVNETQGNRREHLRCRLTARDGNLPEDDPHHVSMDIGHLYHGTLEAEEFTDRQGIHIHTVELKKNTNDVHIVLQNLNGKPVDPDDFIFTITDTNGHMDWNNELLDDDLIAYHPWWTGRVTAGIEQPDGSITTPGTISESRVQTQASAAIADLRTSRLVKDQNAMVTVTRKDGSHVLSVPLIDYAIMVKGQHRHLKDQEYLDRQDDYSMIFFLDDNYEWMDAYIYVNSWKVIVQETDL